MAHLSQSAATKTMSAVKRSRDDLDSFKDHLAQILRSDTPHEQELVTARSLIPHVTKAESLVAKAESTIVRIRQGSRVPPRPAASIPAPIRAKRALSVLLPAVDSHDPDRNVRLKPLPPRKFLTNCDKPPASPIRDDHLVPLVRRASTETGLLVQLPQRAGVHGRHTVYFICQNVFIAVVTFDEVRTSSLYDKTGALKILMQQQQQQQPPRGPKPPVWVFPEHVDVFGTTERITPRWSRSEHAVFNVLTERANAAMRYFISREETGEDAFMAFAKWLGRHKTLFNNTSEDRRLAFDASRGIFLPACVIPFEGDGPPRFTRGTIPLRSSSSTAPPARQPPSSTSVPNVPATSAPATSTVPNTSAPPQASAQPMLNGSSEAATPNQSRALSNLNPIPLAGNMVTPNSQTPSQPPAPPSSIQLAPNQIRTTPGSGVPPTHPHSNLQSHTRAQIHAQTPPQLQPYLPPYAQQMSQAQAVQMRSQNQAQNMTQQQVHDAMQSSHGMPPQSGTPPSVVLPNNLGAGGVNPMAHMSASRGMMSRLGAPPSPQAVAAASAAIAAVQAGANPLMQGTYSHNLYDQGAHGQYNNPALSQPTNLGQFNAQQLAAQLGVSSQMDRSLGVRAPGNPSTALNPPWNRAP